MLKRTCVMAFGSWKKSAVNGCQIRNLPNTSSGWSRSTLRMNAKSPPSGPPKERAPANTNHRMTLARISFAVADSPLRRGIPPLSPRM